MSKWLQRVSSLFGGLGGVPPDAPPTSSPATLTPPTLTPPILAAAASELRLPLFEWLLGAGTLQDAALHDSERPLLARLDAVLASDTSRTALLPRMPALVAQLLGNRRDSEASRRAIARAVIAPMYHGQRDALATRCAARLWTHAEATAAACRQEAARRGLDPFEGYVAGLMHNLGWCAALRAIDQGGDATPLQFSVAFVEAVEPRRETFFGLLVLHAQLGDEFTTLAIELLDNTLDIAVSPLGDALRAADARATLQALDAAGELSPYGGAPH